MFVGKQSESETFRHYSFRTLEAGFIWLLIACLYQFITKRWRSAFVSLTILIAFIGFVFYTISKFSKEQSIYDNFADDLEIPANLSVNEPLNAEDSIQPTKTDFYLYNASQPGLYYYSFYTRQLNKGKIYFKAFEVTRNHPLSAERLKQSSALDVGNPTDSLRVFSLNANDSVYNKPFTIYEGDWGKPYAARFELWYKSEKGGEEKKLLEKIYRIEGWQR